MMLKKLMLLGVLLGTVHAYAAPNPAPAAKPQSMDIQSIMVDRCASEAAAAKVTDGATAKKVCGCTIGVQAQNLKLGEFWAIQSAAMNGKDPRTIAALQRIQPMLDKCRAGVTLNAPQLPPVAAPAKK